MIRNVTTRQMPKRVMMQPADSSIGRTPQVMGLLPALDDLELVQRFERLRIQPAEWTHVEHCRVAYVYLRGLDWAAAVNRMRRGVVLLNQAQNVPNTATRGYHETITIAWLRLIAAALERQPDPGDSRAFLARHPRLLERQLLARHYSPELLCTARARRQFTPPDRQPLP